MVDELKYFECSHCPFRYRATDDENENKILTDAIAGHEKLKHADKQKPKGKKEKKDDKTPDGPNERKKQLEAELEALKNKT